MQTKAQEIAEDIYNEIDEDDNGDEILRDLADGVKSTYEMSKWIKQKATDAEIDEDRIWAALLALAREHMVAMAVAKEAETA